MPAAIAAVEAVGLERRKDLRAALSAVMLDQHDQQADFDAAFDAFFRDPRRRGRPVARSDAPPPTAVPARAKEAPQPATRFGFSERERLQRADFQAMTAAEFELAKALAESAPLPLRPVLRRRHERSARGSVDLRRTLQGRARQPHTLSPAITRPRREAPALVVLIDISGSMDRYARLFLHYAHGLTRRHLQVRTFTFGTRLSHITRCLRERAVDAALQWADTQVHDWKGGTRIASCLDDFNRHRARRVLGANAAVLLVTAGLDRDGRGELGSAAARLHRMAHELVWLNPLLRYNGFEPRAAGVRALPLHVDRVLPVHKLASLADLGRALAAPALKPAPLVH